jgi:hypothetical protein
VVTQQQSNVTTERELEVKSGLLLISVEGERVCYTILLETWEIDSSIGRQQTSYSRIGN